MKITTARGTRELPEQRVTPETLNAASEIQSEMAQQGAAVTYLYDGDECTTLLVNEYGEALVIAQECDAITGYVAVLGVARAATLGLWL